MENSLESLLSEESSTAQEPAEQRESGQHDGTGENTAPPAGQHQENEGEPQGEPQDDESTKQRKGYEAAILAERRRRQEAEQRAHQTEERLAQIQRSLQPDQSKQPKQDASGIARPKRDEFEDQAAYEDALLDYADARRSHRDQESQQHIQQQRYAQAVQQAADDAVTKGQEKYADFDTVVNNGLAPFLTGELRQAMLLSDKAEDVAYHLGKNPAEAARIARLHPLLMSREIALVESKLNPTSQEEGRPSIPRGLTNTRDARGRGEPAYTGPTPLDDILQRKK